MYCKMDVDCNMTKTLYELYIASKTGDLNRVKDIIGDANYTYALSALKWASAHGHFDIVKYITGINIFMEKNPPLDDAFEDACLHGHLDIVHYLASIGADIHSNDDFPIIWACNAGHLDIVKYLTFKGANIRTQDDYATHLAETRGHLHILRHLLSNGVPSTKLDQNTIERIEKCRGKWVRTNHQEFSAKTDEIFRMFFLGIQRLEETEQLPLAHQVMFEEMMENWTLQDDLKLCTK